MFFEECFSCRFDVDGYQVVCDCVGGDGFGFCWFVKVVGDYEILWQQYFDVVFFGVLQYGFGCIDVVFFDE